MCVRRLRTFASLVVLVPIVQTITEEDDFIDAIQAPVGRTVLLEVACNAVKNHLDVLRTRVLDYTSGRYALLTCSTYLTAEEVLRC